LAPSVGRGVLGPAPMGAATEQGPRLSRHYIAAVAVGLGAGAVAFWLYRRSQRRKKKGRQRIDGPSLGEEIDAALALEADELDELDVDLDELKEEFEAAVVWVSANGGGLSNQALLALYACYKQALKGDAPPGRPWNPEACAKWDAWHRLAGMSCAKAMQSYVAALKESVPAWTPEDRGEAAPISGANAGSFGVAVSTMGQLGEDDDVDETPVGQLNELIHNSDIKAALKVLSKSSDLAFKPDKDGMTPMHWAADSDTGEVMKCLIDLLGTEPAVAKTRVNMRDADGNTPLHFAVMAENEDMARLLVAAGADPKAENEDGETSIQLASGEEWTSIFQP